MSAELGYLCPSYARKWSTLLLALSESRCECSAIYPRVSRVKSSSPSLGLV